MDPLPATYPDPVPAYVWQPRPKFQDRIWLHWLLFVLTIVTTTFMGMFHYEGFVADFTNSSSGLSTASLILRGFWYSGTILGILGCHELGHYFACRYYDVDASRPFFIPAPLITGTFGALIRIREPIPTKRMLFDIGIAGPLAGFVIAVPTLFLGIWMSHVAKVPADFVGEELGEPLLFKAATHLIWGSIPDGYSVNLHPMAFGAWFGLLATALNLFPIAQLDGGHISYAVLGKRSSHVTLAGMAVVIALSYFAMSWRVWAVMLLVMLYAFGRHHPPVFDEEVPLDRTRIILAVVALLIFIVSFTPAPIEPIDLLRK